MPCRDDGQAAHYAQQEINKMQERLDMLTRFMCRACEHYIQLSAEPEIEAWWKAHQAADELRRVTDIAREKARREQNEARARQLEAEAAQLRKNKETP